LYVSDRDLFTALSPIHVHLHWGMQATPLDLDILYIGSPIYGIVTTTTEYDGGRGFSKQSAMTLVRPGNNWIPYGYLMNTLDNTGYGIQVNAINGFSGLDISVPRSVRVNMSHLPASPRPPVGDVPIEINGHIVAYAPSLRGLYRLISARCRPFSCASRMTRLSVLREGAVCKSQSETAEAWPVSN